MKQKNVLILVILLFCGFGITNLQAQRDITLGAVETFNATSSSYSKIDKIDETHFIIVYKDGSDSDAIKVKIGEVNPITRVITYGAATTVETDANRYPYVTVLSATKAVVTYELDIATDEANSRIVEFNTATNTISAVSSASTFASDYHSSGFHSPVSIVKLTSTTFAYLYVINSTKNGTLRIGTVDGANNITYGDEYEFEDGVAKFIWGTKLTNDKIVIGYEDDKGDSDYGNLLVASITGTVVSFGDITIFKDPIKNVTVQRMNDSQFVVAYADDPSGSGSDFGFAKVGTVDGTTITVSTAAYTFENTERVTDITIGQLTANEFVVGYSPSATRNSNVVTGKIAGTGTNASITFGTAIEVEALEARGNFLTTLDNSTFVISYDHRTGSDQGETRVGTLPKNTWLGTDGGSPTDWATLANWSLGTLPTAKDLVIVPDVANEPIISSGTNALANIIDIESGSTLNISGGGFLTIDGNLSQNGTFTINSDASSNGSLIVNGTATGNVTYERFISFTLGNTEGWHLVSAPIAGQSFDNTYATNNLIATSGTNRGISTYSNAVASGNWSYLQVGVDSGNFDTGAGYSVKTSADSDVSFTGTINTTDVTKSITVGAETPFNLIGNPFTSSINSGTFLTTNTALLTSETIWLWNPTTKNYDAKISGISFKVAPGQGFFVSAVSNDDVVFEKNSQSHEATNTFLKAENNPEISLNITDGKLNRYAKVLYRNDATKDFDNGLDGERFNGVANELDVFTQLLENNVGKNYQIQSLPNSELSAMIIPVGVIAANGKEITFSADGINLPTDVNIILEDKAKNTFTRLNEANSKYSITLTESLNGVGRFYLHTAQKSLAVATADLKSVSIYKSDATTLKIIGLQEGKSNLKLFNVLGKQVMNTSFNSNGAQNISLPKLAKGVYVVQLSTEKGTLNKKIILE